MNRLLLFFISWVIVVSAWVTVMRFTQEPDRFSICPLCGK